MPLRFRVTQREPLFEVRISGLAFLGHADMVFGQIAQATREAGASLLLLDFLNVLGNVSPEDHAELGYLMARHLAHLAKVAAVVPAGKITRRSETAAQERGLTLRVFASRAEAQEWLRS